MAIFGKAKPTPKENGITLEEAHKVVTAARQKAEEIGVMQNIAVVDEGGSLVAFARMDGAWRGSIDIAINKAFTARAFDMTTEALGQMSQPEDMCYGIHASNDLRVIIFGGGIPLQRGSYIVGAIGVSGGTVPQDIQVAEAGVSAFEENEQLSEQDLSEGQLVDQEPLQEVEDLSVRSAGYNQVPDFGDDTKGTLHDSTE